MKKYLPILILALALSACGDDAASDITFGPGSGVSGVGGSTARFVIKGDYLYIATDTELKVLELRTNQKPVLVSSLPTLGDLETIFNLDNFLLLGSADGVYIYSLQNPAQPRFVTRYVHQLACDPVIAKGNFAYLTLRDGTDCRGQGVNQLITLDISDVSDIVSVDTVEMIRPRGLAFFGGDLFVSEGAFGTKRFDISTPHMPAIDTLYEEILSNDLIGLSDVLITTENEGINQFILENDSLKFLSTIR